MIQPQQKVKKKISSFSKKLPPLSGGSWREEAKLTKEEHLGKVQLPATCRQYGSVARESPVLQPSAHAPAILSHGRGAQTLNGVGSLGV
jgi:hypothetical protein